MGAFVPVIEVDSLTDQQEAIIMEVPTTQVIKKRTAEPIKVESSQDTFNMYKRWEKDQILSSAKNSVTNILNSVTGKKEDLQRRYKIYNMHILSLHKKYALALSCIILFFVGAPLGAIIRKGGIGLPMVIAIVLFLAYYFIGVFAGNYAKEGNIHPILGAWLSTLIMLPLSVFLTKRATADRGLMDFGHVLARIKELFKKKEEEEEE